MNPEIGDYIESMAGYFYSLEAEIRIKLCTPDSVEIAKEILEKEEGWRLVKDDNNCL